MSSSPILKQIATGRRKPDMTRKEYFDHRFRIHGSLTDGVADVNQKPSKYIQTQVFDCAFGAREDGPFNANQYWFGRDDTSELFFRDWDHIKSVFTSAYVRAKIAPDAPLFADFETTISLMAHEKPVQVKTQLQAARANASLEDGDATVAMFFIATPDNVREGEQLEKLITPALVESLEANAQDDVWGLQVNVGVVSAKFDLNAFFGGSKMPQFALVYKVFLKDPSSVPVFRKAQLAFATAAGEHYDKHTSFVLFSREALVTDELRNVSVSRYMCIKTPQPANEKEQFSLKRQPVFQDLPGATHLVD